MTNTKKPGILFWIIGIVALLWNAWGCVMYIAQAYDMEMATNAGVHGLGAGYGVHSEQALRQADAVDVLSSFSEIVDWLIEDRIGKAYA